MIELLIVTSLMGIFIALVIPKTSPSIHDQLDAMAQLLASDIGYARNLAVTNGDKYAITFDLTNNKYTLQHTGTNTSLDTLPPYPFRLATDPANQQIVRLSNLPHIGAGARLYAVNLLSTPVTSTTTLEFGPLGSTTQTAATVVWLASGSGAATRYYSVRVNPLTGLTWIENFQAQAPATGS